MTHLVLTRRQLTQTLALAALPGLGVSASAIATVKPELRQATIAVAIVQSRAVTVSDVARELADVSRVSRKDLICFPWLTEVSDVSALATVARDAQTYVAINDALITPSGAVLSDRVVVDTELGRIAFLAQLDVAAVSAQADILLHLTDAPVAYAQAQAAAVRQGAHVIAATPVGDSFLQASGSVMFSPDGAVMAAAGAAWTQTLTATLHVAHWREARPALAVVSA